MYITFFFFFLLLGLKRTLRVSTPMGNRSTIPFGCGRDVRAALTVEEIRFPHFNNPEGSGSHSRKSYSCTIKR